MMLSVDIICALPAPIKERVGDAFRQNTAAKRFLSPLLRLEAEMGQLIFLVDSLHYNKTLARLYFQFSDVLLGQTEKKIGPYARAKQRNGPCVADTMCHELDPASCEKYEERKPAHTIMVRGWPNLDDFSCGCDFEEGERCLVCGHVGETPSRYGRTFTKDRRRALADKFVHEAVMHGPETFSAAKQPWSWKKLKDRLRWHLFAY